MRQFLDRYRALLTTYLLPQRGKAALLAALVLSNLALQLAGPLIVRSFIDDAIGHAALATLTRTAALYLAVAAVTQVVRVAEAYVAEDVAWRATNLLRIRAVQHCLNLDMSFHMTRLPGELIERIDGDSALLANFFSRFVLTILGNALLLIGVLVVLFGIDRRVGIVMLLYCAVGLAALNRMRPLMLPRWKAFLQTFADLFGFLEERLSGAEDLRANGATLYPVRQLFERFRGYMRIQRTALIWIRALQGLSDLLLAIGTVLAFLLSAYLFKQHAITVGTAYLIVNYVQQLVQPLSQISDQLGDVKQAAGGLARLEDLLAMQPAASDGSGVSLPSGALAVTFDAVSFAYEQVPVLRELSFSLAPARVLGVVGRTGSGKSTIARLLLRFYDPSKGTIALGGVDVRALRFAELRGRVAMVTQEVQLFQATVRDNLTFFNREIGDARILAALESLSLGDWYRALPQGLDTELASGGGGLSAGQAQLLALVRAFLVDPRVVVLDEASSRLDAATERQLEQALDALLRGRTGIVIAHRLATLRRADDILVLDGGCIVEHGPRADLAADPGTRFAQLLRGEGLVGEPS